MAGSKWQKENREYLNRYARERYRRNAADVIRKNKLHKLKRVYGLTPEQYEALGRECHICKAAEGQMNVDHDHNTGKVRGLLCTLCNSGLAFFRDSESLLFAAVEYLRGQS